MSGDLGITTLPRTYFLKDEKPQINKKELIMKTRLKTIVVELKACRMDKIISMLPLAAVILFLIMALAGCHGGHH